MAQAAPVLHQLRVSHFNEKVRWALDYKRIEHERRSVLPGYHQLRARMLSSGVTLPILELDGRRIRNSSDIVAALEQLKPEPALYPADPDERARALELEALFDRLGHDARRVLFDGLLEDPALFVEIFYVGQPEAVKRVTRATFPLARRVLRRSYGVDPEAVVNARDEVVAALDRIAAEARPSGYLVGNAFSIADLTAAAVMFPVVIPDEYPEPLPDPARLPGSTGRFRESLKDHPGFRWVQDTWRRERSPSAELTTA